MTGRIYLALPPKVLPRSAPPSFTGQEWTGGSTSHSRVQHLLCNWGAFKGLSPSSLKFRSPPHTPLFWIIITKIHNLPASSMGSSPGHRARSQLAGLHSQASGPTCLYLCFLDCKMGIMTQPAAQRASANTGLQCPSVSWCMMPHCSQGECCRKHDCPQCTDEEMGIPKSEIISPRSGSVAATELVPKPGLWRPSPLSFHSVAWRTTFTDSGDICS